MVILFDPVSQYPMGASCLRVSEAAFEIPSAVSEAALEIPSAVFEAALEISSAIFEQASVHESKACEKNLAVSLPCS